ncbi:unnamed protein product [Euphydryas editha]|uniref:Uncharacterized protein n=1 Tax=Euphydryas editha TaxID=104508 RepID=A0AAU9U4B1_EUPED|nr:unnamed protein product [Euphydryas editha]
MLTRNANKKRSNTKISPKKSILMAKSRNKKIDKNASIKVLGDNKKTLKRDSSKLDVYEFTYDPAEEPPPTKKKKKKPAAKKPSKPKITVKSNYDKNLAKALATLKNAISSKPGMMPLGQEKDRNEKGNSTHFNNHINEITTSEPQKNVNKEFSIVERNYNSVRVEDIAKDMQVEDDPNIDYSPVNSPCRPQTPAEPNDNHQRICDDNNQSVDIPNVDDPLNLRDDVSFFDEQPAANSSMNVSIRHPLASPWRVEFENLPIKWQVNSYVKPNMTPAVESSFINFNESKKKHVYTNMVPEANDLQPEVVETTPNLKQTSIISFIKEVVDKQENKKKKTIMTPVKANSLFEDLTNTSIVDPIHKKATLNNNPKVINLTPIKDVSVSKSNDSSLTSNETDSRDVQENSENAATTNIHNKKTDKNLTYFGFDESEDQENIYPKKKNNRIKSLRSRTRGILQELNVQRGPTRANIPVAVKSKPIQSSSVLNNMFDAMKSATEPPVFPEVAVDCNTELTDATNVAEPVVSETVQNEDTESVHLFEDIEFVHHHKPSRKSYTKSNKVAFQKVSAFDNNSDSSNDVDQNKSDLSGEDLNDLSFQLPSVKPKKTIKKKKVNKLKLSKKEEKEIEAWAAGFNSMCEDVEEFDLVVE